MRSFPSPEPRLLLYTTNSARPGLSAFAARQQLWGAAAALSRASSVDATSTAVVESKSAPERETRSETPSSRPPAATRRSKHQPLHEPIPSPAPQSHNPVTKESCENGEQGGSQYVLCCTSNATLDSDQRRDSPTTPGPEPTARLIRQHSSFKPSKDNPKKKSGGRLVLTTREAEVGLDPVLHVPTLANPPSDSSSSEASVSGFAKAKLPSLVPY
jgi:polynucleotide 5'-hydroxyl-kinase GRC3/NOL9